MPLSRVLLFYPARFIPKSRRARRIPDRWNRFVLGRRCRGGSNQTEKQADRERGAGRERTRGEPEEANLRNEYDSCKIHGTIRGSLNAACLSVCLRAYSRSHLYARASPSSVAPACTPRASRCPTDARDLRPAGIAAEKVLPRVHSFAPVDGRAESIGIQG